MMRLTVRPCGGPTGIPLLDIPLWLLGIGGNNEEGLGFAFPLPPPGYRTEAEEREEQERIREAISMCLNCGRQKATRRNQFGERVCANCAPDGEAIG